MSTTDDRTESVRSAWTRCLRQEALRMRSADVAVIAHVAIVLATYANADGTNACPRVDTLAAITGRSEDTVSRALQALVYARLLHRKRRPNTSAMCTLLLPLGEVDWSAGLYEFETARQATARRRAKSAARNTVAAGDPDTRPDRGTEPRNPVASGDPEARRGGGSETTGSLSRQGQEPRPDRGSEPRRVGGVHSFLPPVGDPLTDTETVAPVPQPQVRAREAGQEANSPGLQALRGGGRGAGTGQPPLLLPVPHVPDEPAAPLDARLLADRLTSLYGAPIRRVEAVRVALDVLGDRRPHDAIGEVLSAVEADPERFRPYLPAGRRAAGDS